MTSSSPTSATMQPDRPVRCRRRPLVRLLLWIVAVGLAGVLSLAGLAAWVWSQADMSNVGQLGFANQLKIPPLLEPRSDGTGRKIFDLRLQQGTSRFLPATSTPTWGANGAYLGPTLRAVRGDRVAINLRNQLPEATAIHWHGMHLPAAADGGPHQPIEPGATWSPSWRIDQPAATVRYHPHPHERTDDHVTFDLLQVRAAATLTPSPPVPTRPVRHQQLDQADAAQTPGHHRGLGGHQPLGEPAHLPRHGVQFKVAEQAGAPPPTLAGWKDSVFTPPDSTTRLLVRFTDYADPALPYMFHCHLAPARRRRHDGPARRPPARPGAHQSSHPPRMTVGGALVRSAAPRHLGSW